MRAWKLKHYMVVFYVVNQEKKLLHVQLQVEYPMREGSCLSFTIKTLLLSGLTELVSIGNISCY